MRFTLTAMALALSLGTTAQAQSPAAPAAAQPAALCQTNISKEARKSLIDLQTAVNAKQAAAIPGLVTAANAVAKSSDERCFIAQMQIQAAVDANDMVGARTAVEALQASGAMPATKIAEKFQTIGLNQYNAKNYVEAAASFQRAAQLAPGSAEPLVLLAEARGKQGNSAEALSLYRKAIAMEAAAGRKAKENWYQRAVAIGYDAKNPGTPALAREWVGAYPNEKNWRDAIVVYASNAGLDDGTMIDLYRLQRATRSLKGDGEFARYADAAMKRGFSGEAKGVIEEGLAAGKIARTNATFKSALALATSNSAGDRASLAGSAKAAASAPDAKKALSTGEAYFGYGDYGQAAAMAKLALGKPGVDKNLASLRLGMALAMSGDKVGANAALGSVSGTRTEIARYWLAYLATRP